jgi:hypothetical protein
MFFSEEKNQKTFHPAQAYRFRPWREEGATAFFSLPLVGGAGFQEVCRNAQIIKTGASCR